MRKLKSISGNVSADELALFQEFLELRDGVFYWKKSPMRHEDITGRPAGSMLHGYTIIALRGKSIRAHRLMWAWHNPGADMEGLKIDHIDRNTSNNRIENLRLVTHSWNCSNRNREKKSSKYGTGICRVFTKSGSISYKSTITIDGRKFTRQFRSIIEAKRFRSEIIDTHGQGITYEPTGYIAKEDKVDLFSSSEEGIS